MSKETPNEQTLYPTLNSIFSQASPEQIPLETSSKEANVTINAEVNDTSSQTFNKPTLAKAKDADIASSPAKIVSIEICHIVPNPNQPRKSFSEPAILKLADSIRQFGIIQPITVRKSGQLYELISGERRLRAAKELGWECVPCIISDADEETSAQISIIENLIREDLNIFEQATAIETLIDTYSLTQEQIAEKLSSSQSYVANKLRLLRFSAEEREIILANQLTERHARALLRINDQSARKLFLTKVIKSQLNVTNTEIMIGEYLSLNTVSKNSSAITSKSSISSFYNTIKRAISSAKASNLDVKFQKYVNNDYTEIIIRLPNSRITNAEDYKSKKTSPIN